jgi:hypothetical protein
MVKMMKLWRLSIWHIYGGCRFGIFSAACPIEPLHSADCLTILFKDVMRPAHKAELDSHQTLYASLTLEGWCHVLDRSCRKVKGWHHVHNRSCVFTGRGLQVFRLGVWVLMKCAKYSKCCSLIGFG